MCSDVVTLTVKGGLCEWEDRADYFLLLRDSEALNNLDPNVFKRFQDSGNDSGYSMLGNDKFVVIGFFGRREYFEKLRLEPLTFPGSIGLVESPVLGNGYTKAWREHASSNWNIKFQSQPTVYQLKLILTFEGHSPIMRSSNSETHSLTMEGDADTIESLTVGQPILETQLGVKIQITIFCKICGVYRNWKFDDNGRGFRQRRGVGTETSKCGDWL